MRSRRSPGSDPGSAGPVDRNAAIRSDPPSRVERFKTPPVDRNSRSAGRRTHARARLAGPDSLVGTWQSRSISSTRNSAARESISIPKAARKNSPRCLEELSLPSTEREVAFRKGIRYVARLVPRAPKSSSATLLDVPIADSFRLDISRPGNLENLMLRGTTRPQPQPGEVEIRVNCRGPEFSRRDECRGRISRRPNPLRRGMLGNDFRRRAGRNEHEGRRRSDRRGGRQLQRLHHRGCARRRAQASPLSASVKRPRFRLRSSPPTILSTILQNFPAASACSSTPPQAASDSPPCNWLSTPARKFSRPRALRKSAPT